MIVIDPRLDQIQKIIESLVSKTLLYSVNCLVTEYNKLIFTVDNTLLYEIDLKNENNYPMFAFKYSDFIRELSNYEQVDFNINGFNMHDLYLQSNMIYLYNSYKNLLESTPIVAINNDLKNTESFESYLNIKADDGMKYYRLMGTDCIHQYMIPVFTGFPNISSKDTLGIKVHDLNDGFLLVNYNIYKKKISRDINVIFRIINLTR